MQLSALIEHCGDCYNSIFTHFDVSIHIDKKSKKITEALKNKHLLGPIKEGKPPLRAGR
jgi:hypothetical protein